MLVSVTCRREKKFANVVCAPSTCGRSFCHENVIDARTRAAVHPAVARHLLLDAACGPHRTHAIDDPCDLLERYGRGAKAAPRPIGFATPMAAY